MAKIKKKNIAMKTNGNKKNMAIKKCGNKKNIPRAGVALQIFKIWMCSIGGLLQRSLFVALGVVSFSVKTES